MDLDLEIIDEAYIRGTEAEKDNYLEEEQDYEGGDLEALIADTAADPSGGGEGPPESMEEVESNDSDEDEDMEPAYVCPDMEVMAKSIIYQ